MDWPVLASVPAEDRHRLVARLRRRAYRRDEVIFHQGDPADTLHLIAAGHVSVRVTLPGGGSLSGQLPRRERQRTDIEHTIVRRLLRFFAELRFRRFCLRSGAMREKRRDGRKQNCNRVSKFSRFHLLLLKRRKQTLYVLLIDRARARGCASVWGNYDAPKK